MNVCNVHKAIPLHVALLRGAKACVELLLSSGADCNLQVLVPHISTSNDSLDSYFVCQRIKFD